MSAPQFFDSKPQTAMQRIDNALDTAQRYVSGDPLFRPTPFGLRAAITDARDAMRELAIEDKRLATR
jgi:hypothetical protein